MNRMAMALLALASALLIPLAWGWLVHWFFYKYRPWIANSLGKLRPEPNASADAVNWHYQI
jgi:hypothetical protein